MNITCSEQMVQIENSGAKSQLKIGLIRVIDEKRFRVSVIGVRNAEKREDEARVNWKAERWMKLCENYIKYKNIVGHEIVSYREIQ